MPEVAEGYSYGIFISCRKKHFPQVLIFLIIISISACEKKESHVATVTVSPASVTIEIGDSSQFETILQDASGNVLTDRTVSWSSDNETVATVSSSGVVTGISEGGPLTITATSEAKSGTARVMVTIAPVASVLVIPSNANVLVGKDLQFSAAILDARGVSLTDRQVVWSSSNTDIAEISGSGLVTGLESGGPVVTITAMSEGKSGIAQLMVVDLPVGVIWMFGNLKDQISWALDYNQGLLDRNPHIATQIEAKIEMLDSPTLFNEITDGSYYYADDVISVDRRQISLSTVFPQDNMRSDASQSVLSSKLAMPLLEEFMSTPFPYADFYIWYGFIMGNLGGGYRINMEDQETYEARTGPDRLPYEAILFHEISHSYIGNESLTQFLETYLYNMVHTNSPDVESWIYMRGYTAWEDSNTGCSALLDIYQLIGNDNMSKAYKALYLLSPPYGTPLSKECQQVFINLAPTAVKNQVAAKVLKI